MTAPLDDLARRALGWGIGAPLLSIDDNVRDLALAKRPDGSLDLACVAGAANLGQDLALILTTRLASDPLSPAFGFDGLSTFVVETETAMIRERLRASVAKVVAQDARVRTVTVVEVDQPTDPATRTLSLRVEVDTVVSAGAAVANVLLR